MEVLSHYELATGGCGLQSCGDVDRIAQCREVDDGCPGTRWRGLRQPRLSIKSGRRQGTRRLLSAVQPLFGLLQSGDLR